MVVALLELPEQVAASLPSGVVGRIRMPVPSPPNAS
jgi:hypothetical protein